MRATRHQTAFSLYKTLVVMGLWLAFFGLGLLPGCEKESPPPEPSYEVTLLYFNDFHGQVEAFRKGYNDKHNVGGLSRLTAVVTKIREENKAKKIPVLVMVAGDFLQGSTLSTAFQGRVELDLLNNLQLDALTVGNHEFDYGLGNLLELRELALFPMLSATVYKKTSNELLFEPTLIKTLPNGLSVGILGLTTDETRVTTNPKNVDTLRFADPALAMQRYLPELEAQTDLVIALSHVGYEKDLKLARQFPEADVILGGHSHTLINTPKQVGDVILSQAGDRGVYLGRLDLKIYKKQVQLVSASMIPITEDLPKDKQAETIAQDYIAGLDEQLKKVVGSTSVILDADRPQVRMRETNLGSLSADLMRQFAQTDVALINGGAIRASIQPGPITLADITRVFPMNNSVVTCRLDGLSLLRTLNYSVHRLTSKVEDPQFGGFLQISGLRFELKNGKVTQVTIGGEALDPDHIYSVATIDFLADGGDGYEMLKNARMKYNTGQTLRDILLDHLVNVQSNLNAQTDGRIGIR